MASISKSKQRITKSEFMILFRKNLYYGTRALVASLGSIGYNKKPNLNLIRSLAIRLAKTKRELK